MTNAQIIETVNAIPACYAHEVSPSKIEVTYRAKKSDVVHINTDDKTVWFYGKSQIIAIQIANALNFSI